MHAELDPTECKKILADNYYAHLGCYDGTYPYVLPITYMWHDGAIYSFTKEGKKIDIMTRHANVCVQVEQVENGFTWQSVMVLGTFELVTDAKKSQEMKVKLARQFGKITVKERKIPVSPMIADVHEDKGGMDYGIVYRVKPVSMTGRTAALK